MLLQMAKVVADGYNCMNSNCRALGNGSYAELF
jgi:hypothetical protein